MAICYTLLSCDWLQNKWPNSVEVAAIYNELRNWPMKKYMMTVNTTGRIKKLRKLQHSEQITDIKAHIWCKQTQK